MSKTKGKKETLDVTVPGGYIEMIRNIKLEDFRPNPYQPESRIEVAEEVAKEFGLSILHHGLMQTPVGRFILGEGAISQEQVSNGHYEIGDGWLRLAGFKWLAANGHPEYKEMPVSVREFTDQQMADLVMEANTVRKDLNPIELAGFYKQYLDDFKVTQAELAKRHNCSQGEIANTIRLLELPDDIRGEIISQKISATHGLQLLRLKPFPAKQKKMLQECQRGYYSVNQLSNRIQAEIFYSSKSLTPQSYYSSDAPRFDVLGCQECEHAEKIGSPYSSDRKELRCLNLDCWRQKQKDADQAALEKVSAELKAIGIERVYGSDELKHDQWNFLSDDFMEASPACKTCIHRAGKASGFSNDVSIVCLDIECFEQKRKQMSAEAEAGRNKETDEFRGRILKAVEGLENLKLGMRIIFGLLDDDDGELIDWLEIVVPDNEPENFDYGAFVENAIQEKIADFTLEQLVRKLLLFLIESKANSSWQKDDLIPIIERIEAAGSVEKKTPKKKAKKEPVEKPAPAAEEPPADKAIPLAEGMVQCLNCEYITTEEELTELKGKCPNCGKPAQRKIKSFKGIDVEDTAAIAPDLATLTISTPTEPNGQYLLTLGGVGTKAKTLKLGVVKLFNLLGVIPGGTQGVESDLVKILKGYPESENRDILLAILEGKPAEEKQTQEA